MAEVRRQPGQDITICSKSSQKSRWRLESHRIGHIDEDFAIRRDITATVRRPEEENTYGGIGDGAVSCFDLCLQQRLAVSK
jgi:transposase